MFLPIWAHWAGLLAAGTFFLINAIELLPIPPGVSDPSHPKHQAYLEHQREVAESGGPAAFRRRRLVWMAMSLLISSLSVYLLLIQYGRIQP